MTRRIISTAVIAIATAALASPAALARPADMPPAVAKAAAEQQKQASEYPARPIIDRPSYPPNKRAGEIPPVPTATIAPDAPADTGTSWIRIAAIAAGLLAIGGIATGARRIGRSRITA